MFADQLDYIVGVDPHRDSHALAIVHVLSGAVVFESTVVANSDGYANALKLVEAHASGRRAFAVEGTGSFRAGLTRFLSGRGERVLEVGRLRRERRSGGKTDALDAIRAARIVLSQERPATPRAGGQRHALQALVAAREGAVNARRAGLCQLRDLLVTTPEPLRSELRPLTRARLLHRLAATRPGGRRDPERRGAILALRSIARRVLQLTAEERELAREIETLTRTLAPQLLDQPGVGPHAAAQLVLSWSHHGRITSEAAFARLAGAAPIPASSGQTIRYRLDRSGDRKLNRALHMILVTRKRTHPATIAYIQRRVQKAKHDAKQSATSPATSTAYSNTDRHWHLTNIEASLAQVSVLGREQFPVPLGDDLDGPVNYFDGGLVVDRVRRARQVGRPLLCGGHRVPRQVRVIEMREDREVDDP
jgi:transposase